MKNPAVNLKKGFQIVTNLIPEILTAMDNLADPLKDDLKGVIGQINRVTKIGGAFIDAGGDDVESFDVLKALKTTGKDIADKVIKVQCEGRRFFGNGASPAAMTLLCSDVLVCPCRLDCCSCPPPIQFYAVNLISHKTQRPEKTSSDTTVIQPSLLVERTSVSVEDKNLRYLLTFFP